MEEIYEMMRTFAEDKGYDLEGGEIRRIIERAEKDGDSILDCSEGTLQELVEDWIADHQE